MTMGQTAMVLCIIGSTFLLAIPDNSVASDKFFQTGGRFGKRHEERISGTKIINLYEYTIYLSIMHVRCAITSL